MINIKYSIDRIEENIVVIENIETKEKIELEKDELPDDIKEGNILRKEDNKYILDYEEETKRKNDIINRFQRLKKN